MLAYYAVQQKQNGKTIEQVYQWIEQNKLHLCHWFTVDDLNHLKRGGRISPAVAFVGSLLGVKPILHVDDTGPVSYTHLDVYKRQAKISAAAIGLTAVAVPSS